jgi:hypothetical protein
VSDAGPRVDAAPGRPETPDEREQRQAEARRLRRARQNVRNLAASLAVCIGIVLAVVLLVPRGTPPATAAVDYRSLAAQSEDTAGQPLLAPAVPASWRANAAELRQTDGVTSWYVGFVTDEQQYLAYSEGIGGNRTWLGDTLASAPAGGTTQVGGLTWRVYDQRDLGQGAGNVAYALATRIGTTYLAVYGTASAAQTRSLASSLAAEAAKRHLPGANGAA